MKTIFRISFVFICLFTFSNAQAQLEKVMHQTFEVGDDMEGISLDLVGDYSIEKWAGNTIMTETKVKLYEASPAILNHFVTKGKRYEILADTLSSRLVLSSFDKEREPIRRSKDKECFEEVNVRIFVPDTFEMTSDSTKTLVRKKVD